jgi:hypothetical protein
LLVVEALATWGLQVNVVLQMLAAVLAAVLVVMGTIALRPEIATQW